MKIITAILLAAGLSSRMKSFKPLMPFGPKSIISHIVDIILQTDIQSLIVVTGHNADLIKKELSGYQVNIVFNPDYKEGMLTSVMCGISYTPLNSDAAMIFLVDQPHINKVIVDKLINSYHKSKKGIIVPSFNNRRGHPIIIDRRYFNDIKNLKPDIGLKGLLIEHNYDIGHCNLNDDSILLDMDTPEDYQELIKKQ